MRNRFNENHNPLDFLFLNKLCLNGMIKFNKDYKFNVSYGLESLMNSITQNNENKNTKKYLLHIQCTLIKIFICSLGRVVDCACFENK